MFLDVKAGLNAALDRVRQAERPALGDVAACLRAAQPVLLAAGCTEEEIAAVAGGIINELMDHAMLERDGGADTVAATMKKALFAVPAVKATRGGTRRSTVRRSKTAAPTFFLIQPVTEGRGAVSAQPAKPFLIKPLYSSSDQHHPSFDRAAVRRMVRSLGPDFGPEPPAGGSLSRVC